MELDQRAGDRQSESQPAEARRARASGKGYGHFDDEAFQRLYAEPREGGLRACTLRVEGMHCAACVWLLERLPRLCPGVVEPQSNYIEHPQLIAQRICRYADLVGRDRVMAGVDCGFGTGASANPAVDPLITMAKLRALHDGAELASKQLWA